MSDRAARGAAVEAFAAQRLERAGLKVVARNVRCRYGEIDLLLRDGPILVFAEVRYRGRDDFGGALASVDPRKQSRLIACARWYLGQNPREAERTCRFDVVAVGDDGAAFEWLRDAFRADS